MYSLFCGFKKNAVEKSMGVWQHNEWFIYPTKGFAMNKYNTSIRMSINKIYRVMHNG